MKELERDQRLAQDLIWRAEGLSQAIAAYLKQRWGLEIEEFSKSNPMTSDPADWLSLGLAEFADRVVNSARSKAGALWRGHVNDIFDQVVAPLQFDRSSKGLWVLKKSTQLALTFSDIDLLVACKRTTRERADAWRAEINDAKKMAADHGHKLWYLGVSADPFFDHGLVARVRDIGGDVIYANRDGQDHLRATITNLRLAVADAGGAAGARRAS